MDVAGDRRRQLICPGATGQVPTVFASIGVFVTRAGLSMLWGRPLPGALPGRLNPEPSSLSRL